MLISKLKTMAGLFMTVGLLACGAGAMTLTADEPQTGGTKTKAAQVTEVRSGQIVADANNDVILLLAGGKVVPLKVPLRPQSSLWQKEIQQPAQPPHADILQEVHKHPRWANFCASCHQPVEAPARRALEDWLQSKRGRNPAQGGDIIIIRLPKKSSPEGDAQFLRRVCLDVLGRAPTPLEMDYFLADQNANKYRRVVERLAGHTATPPAPLAVDLPKQATVRHAEAYVREKLGKQQLSPAEQRIVERVVEFMKKQPK